jgi:surface antigen
MIANTKPLSAAVLCASALLTTVPAVATPPPWAPAHGYRAKYAGYGGREWDRDYGVTTGHCNRADVGTVIGGAIGGAVGSTVGKGDTRVVAIIAGTVLGAVIGREIGKDMDREDRGCLGHSLELTKGGTTVRWDNPAYGVTYALTPTRDIRRDGRDCREFKLAATKGSRRESGTGVACRTGDGQWNMVS